MESQQVTIGGLLLAAVAWLVRRLSVSDKKLDDSYKRESAMKDLRAEELVEHAKQMSLNNELIKDALRRHDTAVASLENITIELKNLVEEFK